MGPGTCCLGTDDVTGTVQVRDVPEPVDISTWLEECDNSEQASSLSTAKCHTAKRYEKSDLLAAVPSYTTQLRKGNETQV